MTMRKTGTISPTANAIFRKNVGPGGVGQAPVSSGRSQLRHKPNRRRSLVRDPDFNDPTGPLLLDCLGPSPKRKARARRRRAERRNVFFVRHGAASPSLCASGSAYHKSPAMDHYGRLPASGRSRFRGGGISSEMVNHRAGYPAGMAAAEVTPALEPFLRREVGHAAALEALTGDEFPPGTQVVRRQRGRRQPVVEV